VNNPKDYTQHLEHGESLKSRNMMTENVQVIGEAMLMVMG
jgi:hypothetical protein